MLRFDEGDKVVIVNNHESNHGFKVGRVVTIVCVCEKATKHEHYLAKSECGIRWYVKDSEIEEYKEEKGMKIVEKQYQAFDSNSIDFGDVIITRTGAKYLVVGDSNFVRCVRLDDKNGKQPLSLTQAFGDKQEMVSILFGIHKDGLTLIKDVEIHI